MLSLLVIIILLYRSMKLFGKIRRRVGCAAATYCSKDCCDDREGLVTSSGARWFTHARLPSRAFRNRTLRGACSRYRHFEEDKRRIERGVAAWTSAKWARPRRLEPSLRRGR